MVNKKTHMVEPLVTGLVAEASIDSPMAQPLTDIPSADELVAARPLAQPLTGNSSSDMQITQIPAKLSSTKLLRVAAYARVSSGKDAMLQSLSAQVSYYSELIQANPEWLYLGVYADEDYTGTKDARPEFQRLLTDCRAGAIDLILTKSVSRFARNTLTTLKSVRELKALGIDCYFEEEHIHSMSEDGELVLTLLASYAQEESFSASENCKWKIRHGFQDGKPTYTSPFGYEMINSKLVVIPDEAEIVKTIFALYLSGLGKNAIVKELTERGITTRKGHRFSESVIASMLKNEKYAGDLCLQKTFVIDHISKKQQANIGQLPSYYVHDAHEAIIDRATFEKVQAEIARKARLMTPKRPPVARYPFTGMMTCGNCGAKYHRKTTKGKVAWNCITYLREGKQACHSKQIPEDKLIQMSAEVLRLDAFDADVLHTKVREIRVPAFNHVVFVMTDGREIEKTWADRSRAESWTDVMRDMARNAAKRSSAAKRPRF